MHTVAFGTFPPPLLFTILSVRLRIEEERLLEMKRIEELERIRGPSEAWYDLHLPRESKKKDAPLYS